MSPPWLLLAAAPCAAAWVVVPHGTASPPPRALSPPCLTCISPSTLPGQASYEAICNRASLRASSAALCNRASLFLHKVAPEGTTIRNAGSRTSSLVRSSWVSLVFCANGLRILSADMAEAVRLLSRCARGRSLGPRERRMITRLVRDLLLLVPYSIIAVVPLSPPGHAFAFGLMQRCFPAGVPSSFTSERQRPLLTAAS